MSTIYGPGFVADMKTPPKALRLAVMLQNSSNRDGRLESAADELRRLHAANVELLDALDAISKNDPYHFSSAGIIARKALEKHGATP